MINVNEHIAVISSGPLHKALMMMIVSQRLKTEGRKNVTTFSKSLSTIATWFCIHKFGQLPSIDEISSTFSNYQSLILLYENNHFCNHLIAEFRKETSNTKLFIFYPTKPNKVKTSNPNDFIFDNNLCMVENIASCISKILRTKHHSKSNGLSAPLNLNLVHRKHIKKIFIQTDQTTKKRLTNLCQTLTKLGFKPYFYQGEPLEKILCLIYESGYFIGSSQSDLSTLASNLYIPSLLLKKRLPCKLNHSGWLQQAVITPPLFFRNFMLPLPKRTLNAFKKLVVNHHELIS